MEVEIVSFPSTRVAVIEHFGPRELEHETVLKLVAWKKERRLLDPVKYRSYGIHYTNPVTTAPSQHHVDFCLSFDEEVAPNSYGITSKVIPAMRCALAQDIGSRYNNKAAAYINEIWLPKSGEAVGDFPMFFHYVNLGPNLKEEEMITDVYLPLK